MAELIQVKKLTQKERAQVIPPNTPVQILYELTDPQPIRTGRIDAPIMFKGKVKAYQIKFDDGTRDEWVPLTRIRIPEDQIDPTLQSTLKGLMSPWQKEKAVLDDPTSIFGGYLRDSGLTTSMASSGDEATIKKENKRLDEIRKELDRQTRQDEEKEAKKEAKRAARLHAQILRQEKREIKQMMRDAERASKKAAKDAAKGTGASSSSTPPTPSPQTTPTARRKALPPKSMPSVGSILPSASPQPQAAPVPSTPAGSKISNPSPPSPHPRREMLCMVTSPRDENPRKRATPKQQFVAGVLDKTRPTKKQWMDVAPDLLIATDVVLAMEDALEPSIFARLQNGVRQSWENLSLDRDAFKAALGECIQRAANPRHENPKVAISADLTAVDALFDDSANHKPSEEILPGATLLRDFLSMICRPLAVSMTGSDEADRDEKLRQFLLKENTTRLADYGAKCLTLALAQYDPSGKQKSPVDSLFPARQDKLTGATKKSAPDIMPIFPIWAAMWLNGAVFAHTDKMRPMFRETLVQWDGVSYTAGSLLAAIMGGALGKLANDFSSGNDIDIDESNATFKLVDRTKRRNGTDPIRGYARKIADSTLGANTVFGYGANAIRVAMLLDSYDTKLTLLTASFVATIAGGTTPFRNKIAPYEPFPVASMVILRLIQQSLVGISKDRSFLKTAPSYLSPPRLLAAAYFAGCRSEMSREGQTFTILFEGANEQFTESKTDKVLQRLYALIFASVDNLFTKADEPVGVEIPVSDGRVPISLIVKATSGNTIREKDFSNAFAEAINEYRKMSPKFRMTDLDPRDMILHTVTTSGGFGQKIPWGLGDILMIRAPRPKELGLGVDLRNVVYLFQQAIQTFQQVAKGAGAPKSDVEWFNLLSVLSRIDLMAMLLDTMQKINDFPIPKYDTPAPRLEEDFDTDATPVVVAPTPAADDPAEEPQVDVPQEEGSTKKPASAKQIPASVQEPVQEPVQAQSIPQEPPKKDPPAMGIPITEQKQEPIDPPKAQEPPEDDMPTAKRYTEAFKITPRNGLCVALVDGARLGGRLPSVADAKFQNNKMRPMTYFIDGKQSNGIYASRSPVWQFLYHYNWTKCGLLVRASSEGVPVIRELRPNAWQSFINGIKQDYNVYWLRRVPESSPLAPQFAWEATTHAGLLFSSKSVPVVQYSENVGIDQIRPLLNDKAWRVLETFRTPEGLDKWSAEEQEMIRNAEAEIPIVATFTPLSGVGTPEQRQALSAANVRSAVILSASPADQPVEFVRARGGSPQRMPIYARIAKPADLPAFETHLYKQNVIAEKKQGRISEEGAEEKQQAAEQSMAAWKEAEGQTLVRILGNPDGYTRNTLGAVYRYALGGCKGTPLQIYNGRYPRRRLMHELNLMLSKDAPPAEASANARSAWIALKGAWNHRAKTTPPTAIFGNRGAVAGSCEIGDVMEVKQEPEPAPQPEPEQPKEQPPRPEPEAPPQPKAPTPNPSDSWDVDDGGDGRGDNPMKDWSSWRDTEYPYLTKTQVDRVIPLMKALGVSEVARSKSGFIGAYNEAGSPAGLSRISEKQGKPPWFWWNRREGFNKRHITQVTDKKKGGETEPLWVDGKRFGMDKIPSRRHLALIAWYWTPHSARFEAWLKDNARALSALARGEAPRAANPTWDNRPHPDSPGWFAEYTEDPFTFPITVVKNAERRMKKESQKTGFPFLVMREVFRRGWLDWREQWADEKNRGRMDYGQPHEHAIDRLRRFQRGDVLPEDMDLHKQAMAYIKALAERGW